MDVVQWVCLKFKIEYELSFVDPDVYARLNYPAMNYKNKQG